MTLPEQKSAENLELKESALVTAGWSAEARKDAFERTIKSGCRPLEMNIGNTPIPRV